MIKDEQEQAEGEQGQEEGSTSAFLFDELNMEVYEEEGEGVEEEEVEERDPQEEIDISEDDLEILEERIHVGEGQQGEVMEWKPKVGYSVFTKKGIN